jgi:type IV secretory pathway TraG/TraD family ATPase VirD4
LTLACLQDLSQARGRWGSAAEGFFSLVLLPGVGDLRTLDTVSRLAGQGDVAVRSVNASAWWSGRPSASTTRSTRRQERLPVDQVHSLAPGTALVIAGARPPQRAALTPWWGYPPFWEARRARPPALLAVTTGTTASGGPNRAPLSPPLPPPPPPGAPKPSGHLPVSWRRVPGQRRAQPRPPRL